LFEQFAGMLRDTEQKGEEQAHSRLEEWPERPKASGIAKLEAFAVKLLQDSEVMVATMILPYSQRQTEGGVNKLMVVKRFMYGRGRSGQLRPSASACPLRGELNGRTS
jgi:transposase